MTKRKTRRSKGGNHKGGARKKGITKGEGEYLEEEGEVRKSIDFGALSAEQKDVAFNVEIEETQEIEETKEVEKQVKGEGSGDSYFQEHVEHHKDSTSNTITAIEDVIQEYIKPFVGFFSRRFGFLQRFLDLHGRIKASVIYFIIACDALSFTLLEPLLPLMVEARMDISEEVVGTYVGFIIGAFSASQFITSPFYGWLSDTLGRRVFIVGSLFVSILCLTTFGFLTNVYLAILVRFIEGFFNSANPMCRAYLIDMSTPRNRDMNIAYLGGVQALSRSLSAGFAGLSVALAKSINSTNPYLFPLLFGSAIIVLALFLALNLSEPATPPHGLENSSAAASLNIQNLTVSLPSEMSSAEEYQISHKTRQSFWDGIREIFSKRIMIFAIIMFSFNHFCNGASLMLMVLMAEESIPNFGLGFSSLETGLTFMAYGLLGCLFQFLLLKRLIKYVGIRKLYFLGTIFSAIHILALPFISIPYWINGFRSSPMTNTFVVFFLIGVTIIAAIGKVTVTPLIQCILANITDSSKQGLVQGSSMSIGVLFKALGPFICGYLFTLSIRFRLPFLVFTLLFVLYVVTGIMSLFLPSSVEIQQDWALDRGDEKDFAKISDDLRLFSKITQQVEPLPFISPSKRKSESNFGYKGSKIKREDQIIEEAKLEGAIITDLRTGTITMNFHSLPFSSDYSMNPM